MNTLFKTGPPDLVEEVWTEGGDYTEAKGACQRLSCLVDLGLTSDRLKALCHWRLSTRGFDNRLQRFLI